MMALFTSFCYSWKGWGKRRNEGRLGGVSGQHGP